MKKSVCGVCNKERWGRERRRERESEGTNGKTKCSQWVNMGKAYTGILCTIFNFATFCKFEIISK